MQNGHFGPCRHEVLPFHHYTSDLVAPTSKLKENNFGAFIRNVPMILLSCLTYNSRMQKVGKQGMMIAYNR